MSLFDWLLKTSEPAEPGGVPKAAHLAPGRGFIIDVVGEANYQDALDDICGGKCEDGHNLPVTAQLCFQEDNPYDRNAVAVLVYRRLVGYIPRNTAPWMRSEILRINPDERPVICDAKIVGGWDRGEGDEGHYGVKLSIADPMRVIQGSMGSN